MSVIQFAFGVGLVVTGLRAGGADPCNQAFDHHEGPTPKDWPSRKEQE